MFLFILDSIGTSELLLIAVVALIFLGPRKLPQIARTIGRTMAEFRNATNEFKTTWQREVDFEEEAAALRTGELPPPTIEPVPRTNSILGREADEQIAAPKIRQIDKEAFDELARAEKADEPTKATPAENDPGDKRSWL